MPQNCRELAFLGFSFRRAKRQLLALCLLLLPLVTPLESLAKPHHPAQLVVVPTLNNTEFPPRGPYFGDNYVPGEEMWNAVNPWDTPSMSATELYVEHNQTYRVYIRSDIAPETVTLRKYTQGFVSASRNLDYPYVDLESYYRDGTGGSDWADHFPPTALAAATNITYSYLPLEFLVEHQYEMSPDTGSEMPFEGSEPDWYYFEGATYYELVGSESIAPDRFVIEGRCSLYQTCVIIPPYEEIESFDSALGESHTTFLVGAVHPYKRKPGNAPGPKKAIDCYAANATGRSGGLFSAALNIATGNLLLTLDSPAVQTRSYPLHNRIYVNSEPLEMDRPMMNASFTYDIHIIPHFEDLNWTVVDGDGQLLDFGNGSEPAPGYGVFSNLEVTSEGFTLSGAGAPENLRNAGNFSYAFNSEGALISITDPAGNVQSLSYTAGKLTEVTDLATDKVLAFNWTEDKITSVVSNDGSHVLITYREESEYERDDLVTSITAEDSSSNAVDTVAFTYELNSITSFERGGNAGTKHYVDYVAGSYDDSVSIGLASISLTDDPDGAWISPEYVVPTDVEGANVRHIVYTENGRVTYDLDEHLNVIRIDDGSSVQLMEYDNGLLTSWTDGSTSRTYEYETNGKLHKVNRPNSTFFQYDWDGANLVSVSDSIGTLFEYTYDDSGHPNTITSVTDGSDNTWEYELNDFGQVASITPPTGSPFGGLTFDYDEGSTSPSRGLLTKVTDALGNETRFEAFDSFGHPTSMSTDPDPITSSTRIVETKTVDDVGRLTSVVHADTMAINFTYTGRELTGVADENEAETIFSYCPSCGALEGEEGPLSHTLAWARNADHQLSSFTDARSNATNYTYDGSGRLTQTLFPEGWEQNYTYDESGRLEKIFRPGFGTTMYDYDGVGRLYNDYHWDSETPSQTFTYRDDDSLLSVAHNDDIDSEISYEYYPNRLVQAVVYDYSGAGLLNLQRVEYEYWPDNLVKKVTWKNGETTVGTWEYSYDAAGRMTEVASFGGSTTYTYDGQGKILSQTNANGTTTTYAWNDARRWPTLISHNDGEDDFASYALTYDEGANTIGNLTEVEELSGATMTYEYDALYRLTGESRTGLSAYETTYEYDLAGNLTSLNGSSFASYDEGNRPTLLTGEDFVTDAAGSIMEISTSSLGSMGFGFDWRLNLTGIGGDAVELSAGSSLWLLYDYRGRLIREHNGATHPEGPRFLIYDREHLLGEIVLEYGEESDSYTPKVAYTWGSDGLVSERLFGAGSGGSDKTLWYHFGPQAETRYLTDAGGEIADTYRYDAFGNLLGNSGSDYNPHKYGGKVGYYSPVDIQDGKVIHAGARWYLPSLRRWMSRDPIGYEGGENLAEYVKSRPTTLIDSTGRLPVKNGTGGPIYYKPEKRENIVDLCPAGEECPMDGVYPPGKPPRKFRDSCIGTPTLNADCSLEGGLCAPFFTENDLGPDFFEKWTNWPDPYSGANGWPLVVPLTPLPKQ